MSGRHARIAVALVAASAMLMATAMAAAVASRRFADDAGWSLLGFVLPVAAFSLVGGLISVRRPENRIGWLLAAIGLLFALVTASSAIAVWALETGALPQAAAEWIAVLSTSWVIGLGLSGTQLPLRLPDGRLPSPRWRWFSRLTIGLIAVSTVGMAVQPGFVEEMAGTANPLGSETLKPLAYAFMLVIACFVGSLAGLIVRYRRAGARDRQQLRWIALGGAVFLVVYLVTLPIASAIGEESAVGTALTNFSQAAFAALPIAIGYSVLKHRLYDIDVVVNRALVYGVLTATLAGAYLAGVLVLQLALRPGSDLAIAGSTLAVAALFRPARKRIQGLVDRRFYRRKYDAQRTLESFSARLRDEVALDATSDELRAVVAEAMQPAHVSLWIRSR